MRCAASPLLKSSERFFTEFFGTFILAAVTVGPWRLLVDVRLGCKDFVLTNLGLPVQSVGDEENIVFITSTSAVRRFCRSWTFCRRRCNEV
jgi:hypothetical protein